MNLLVSAIDTATLITFLFKPVVILFSVFYLFYTVIILRQTQVMNQALKGNGSNVMFLGSAVQFGLALLLLFLAITFI